jgi:hypothetical protein
MVAIRNLVAAALAAIAGWLAMPTSLPAIDAERARCDAAVAVAYAALAGDAPAPAPPEPPKPEAPCAGKCSAGIYKPDGRIEARCGKECPCGCQRQRPATKCGACLDTGNTMGGDGIIRPCSKCRACATGTCPTR